MNRLVLYDSFFGNTKKVAEAITGAIDEVVMHKVGEIDARGLEPLDLLIVGSPTRAFRASDATRKFLSDIPNSALKEVKVAAFDTRISGEEVGRGLRLFMKIGGYAAPRIDKELRRKGGVPAAEPEGFYVKDREGPLMEGELERAVSWASGIIGWR